MAAHTFVTLDYVVLISFLLLSAGIGVYFRLARPPRKFEPTVSNGEQATELASSVDVNDGELPLGGFGLRNTC
ncbi:hypothetical protein MRX96_048368 [Rhipicephalus microplus]